LPNRARNWSPDIPLCLGMVVTGSLAHKRTWHHSKEVDLMAWGGENQVQNRRKTSHLPCFSSFSVVSLSLSLSLSLLSPSQLCLQPPPPLSPPAGQPSSPPHFSLSTDASPFFSTTAAAYQYHHFCFLPSLAPAAATSAPTSTSTIGFTTIISINPAPHQWQSSHRDLLSLLLPAFLSPLQPFLLPPTADSGHHHLSRRPLSHRPNHLITTETPTPGNFLLPALPLSSSSWLLHAEFISACNEPIN